MLPSVKPRQCDPPRINTSNISNTSFNNSRDKTSIPSNSSTGLRSPRAAPTNSSSNISASFVLQPPLLRKFEVATHCLHPPGRPSWKIP
mmetsp:Transcript_67435/g.140911  ORF Transcript_67435/g.140911 Transcript_67435/m.140911 type:complete len:89 (+) Transcript_67435:293-559(+)